MKQPRPRPVRNTVVTVRPGGPTSNTPYTYTGRVTSWSEHDPYIFWLMVEKISGVDKEPGTYPEPIPYSVEELVE